MILCFYLLLQTVIDTYKSEKQLEIMRNVFVFLFLWLSMTIQAQEISSRDSLNIPAHKGSVPLCLPFALHVCASLLSTGAKIQQMIETGLVQLVQIAILGGFRGEKAQKPRKTL